MSEIAVVEQSGNIMSVIERAASDPNVDVEKMDRLITMQERVFNKNAEIAFNKQMTLCQKAMPVVVRDAVNDQTGSTYAKLETIINQTKPTYTEYGFSLSFGTDESPMPEHIRVTAELMHSEGHSKKLFVDLPLDIAGIRGTQNKTGVHATGSTFSYGKRYLFCMAFNISLANHDDDANRSGGITTEDLLEYNAFVRHHYDEIYEIKAGIANEDLERSAMAWMDMSQEERNILWKAPTKGGILTTAERSAIQDHSFTLAVQAILPAAESKQ